MLTIGQYINMDMRNEKGASLPTGYLLNPAPAPADMAKMVGGTDPGWVEWTYPWHSKSSLKAFTFVRFFFPAAGVSHPSMTDVWFTPVLEDDAFTTELLGCIADHWHRMLLNYFPESEWGTKSIAARALDVSERATSGDRRKEIEGEIFAMPTLSMSLDIKKLLPPEGVKWLFVRAQAKQIRNGRFDAEVTIWDEHLELVALSHHVSFVLNFPQTSGKDDKSMRGKL